MARTVQDAAILLASLQGADERDQETLKFKEIPGDYSQNLRVDGLQGKRIGVEKEYLKHHEAVDSLLQKALDQLKAAGAEVVTVNLNSTLEIGGAEYELLQQEFKYGLDKYLASSAAKVRNLADVIAFNQANESRVMPYFKQEILESSQEKKGLDSEEYKAALSKVVGVREKIDKVLKANNLHAICGPANGPSWCTDLINGDFFSGYGMYSPAAMAGYPHITVPMGMVHGLPVGLCFLGTAYAEGVLIEIAYAYEQKSGNRSRPVFDL